MGEKSGPLFPYERAWQVGIDARMKYAPNGELACVAGSLRRGAEMVHDVDVLVCRNSHISGPDMIHEMVPFGDGRMIQVDIRFIRSDSWGPALQYFTGSWKHNVSVRRIAKQRGLIANEYGVFRLSDNKRVDDGTEWGFYQAIGLRWLPPEYRNGFIGGSKK